MLAFDGLVTIVLVQDDLPSFGLGRDVHWGLHFDQLKRESNDRAQLPCYYTGGISWPNGTIGVAHYSSHFGFMETKIEDWPSHCTSPTGTRCGSQRSPQISLTSIPLCHESTRPIMDLMVARPRGSADRKPPQERGTFSATQLSLMHC